MTTIIKKIISILTYLLLTATLVVGFFYYINFRYEGYPAYVAYDTNVYSTDKATTVENILPAGSRFTLLTTFDNTVRIRYMDEDAEKVKIGFIKRNLCNTYSFPAIDSSKKPIITYLKNEVTYEEFVALISSISNEYDIIGIYLDYEIISEMDLYELIEWCTELHVPYGLVYDLSEGNLDQHIENISSDEYTRDVYNILPDVFNYDHFNSDKQYYPDNFQDSILKAYSDRNPMNRTFKKLWIYTNDFQNKPSVVFGTFDSDPKFEYVMVESDFYYQIYNSYNEITYN